MTSGPDEQISQTSTRRCVANKGQEVSAVNVRVAFGASRISKVSVGKSKSLML